MRRLAAALTKAQNVQGKHMTTMDGASTDASIDAIVQSLATFGKAMPSELIAGALKFGKPLEKRLIALLCDEATWTCSKDDPGYLVPLCAVVILGHMTSVQAGRAMARALGSASKHWSKALDSLDEQWPRLIHNKPPEVLPSFERLMRSQNQNCNTRSNAAHVLLVAALKERGAKFDELLSYFRVVLDEEMEDLIFRHKVARILTSVPSLPDELARKIVWFISPLNPKMETISIQ
jgi:hypothetical protein